jgi:hypothetical protein
MSTAHRETVGVAAAAWVVALATGVVAVAVVAGVEVAALVELLLAAVAVVAAVVAVVAAVVAVVAAVVAVVAVLDFELVVAADVVLVAGVDDVLEEVVAGVAVVAGVVPDAEEVAVDVSAAVVAAAATPAPSELVDEDEHPTAINADTTHTLARNARKTLGSDLNRIPHSPRSFRLNYILRVTNSWQKQASASHRYDQSRGSRSSRAVPELHGSSDAALL